MKLSSLFNDEWKGILSSENKKYQKKAIQMLASFLIVMILLTIVSRAADAASMAKVKTGSAISGSINYSVEVSGNIEAKGLLSVFVHPGILVKHVDAREGMNVAVGDILFSIDMDDLNEHIRLTEKEKEHLKLQIQDMNKSKSEAKKQQDKEVDRAKEDYEDIEKTSQNTVDEMWKELKLAEHNLNAHILSKSVGFVVTGVSANSIKESEGRSEQEVWEEQKSELERLVKQAEQNYEAARKEKESAEKSANRQMEDAGELLEGDNSIRYLEMDLEEVERKLQKLEKLKDEKGEVKAEKEGTITNICAEVGSTTAEGPALFITDARKGYQFVGQITKEQREMLSVGDMVTVFPSYTFEQFSNIRIDAIEPVDELGNCQVIIQVEGDAVGKGGSATMEMSKYSDLHSSCVPLGTLHYQNGELVVYTVVEKVTVLGIQNVLEAVPVSIQEQDGSMAAIEGNISWEADIVVETNKPIKAGDRVRLLEK